MPRDGAPPPDEAVLRQMADAIEHRGPDADGYHVDAAGGCGLAFRRLAIIDLATGNQPLSNEDGTVWLVFNGEIYNYRALRDELRAAGHTFRTQSDSEVIVHAFEQWGTGCFERLDGMFAVALWDSRQRRLVLACDRFAKKPLYFAERHGAVYFASELKSILAAKAVEPTIDPWVLHHYFVFQYVPGPRAIYRGAYRLPPGTWVEFGPGAAPHNGGAPAFQRYYRVPDPPAYAGSRADAKARLGELLEAAVAKRLISDVPLGAFLSGGVDSSLVVALMRRLGVSPLRTFTIGFDDPQYDESAYAREVARRFETEHHEHRVTPEAREIFDALAVHYDEPFADSSAIPTMLLSRWTRQSVTVALTGDGGDEAFGGYDRYRAAALATKFDGLPASVRRAASGMASMIPHGRPKSVGSRAHRFLKVFGDRPSRRYADWVAVFPPAMLHDAYKPEFAERLGDADVLADFDALYDQPAASRDAAFRAAYVDYHTYLPHDLLTKVDRASMAASLECRCPFLDPAIVEFGLSLPTEWKLDTAGGKKLLREFAADFIPPEVLNRPKTGFGVPIGEWFRGPLRVALEECVRPRMSLCRRIFRPEFVDRLLAEHASGAASHAHRLWAMLMLERWAARWDADL